VVTCGYERLTSVSVVPPSVDVRLQVLSVCQLCLVLLLLGSSSFNFGSVEVGEVSFVVVQTLGVLVNNVGSDVIEEGSVVRASR